MTIVFGKSIHLYYLEIFHLASNANAAVDDIADEIEARHSVQFQKVDKMCSSCV